MDNPLHFHAAVDLYGYIAVLISGISILKIEMSDADFLFLIVLRYFLRKTICFFYTNMLITQITSLF